MKVKYLIAIAALVLVSVAGKAPGPVAGNTNGIDYGPNASLLPSNGEMFGWINDLWEMGDSSEAGFRKLGTDAGHEAEDYIAERFRELGLQDVQLEPVDITSWESEDWGLSVQAGTENASLSAYPIQYTASSGPEGLDAELVYVGRGRTADFSEKDVAGKIAVVDIRTPTIPWAITRPTAYLNYDPDNTLVGQKTLVTGMRPNFKAAFGRAVSNDAAGFVGILKDLPASITDHFGPYDGVLRPIPGLWLGSEDGAYLRNLLTEGAVSGHLLLDASARPAVTNNVIGVLPGMTEKIILIETHHDGWAVNDASGVAVVLGLAEYFAQFPPEARDKTLMFVATGRFHGGAGAKDFVQRHQDLLPDIVTAIAIEHVGKEYVDVGGELVETGLVSPRILWVSPDTPLVSFTTDAVVRYDLKRTSVQPAGADAIGHMFDPPRPIGEAGPYYLAGVPVIAHFSWPLISFSIEHDTPDKVAVDQLKPLVAAYADIIAKIDDTPSELIMP